MKEHILVLTPIHSLKVVETRMMPHMKGPDKTMRPMRALEPIKREYLLL